MALHALRAIAHSLSGALSPDQIAEIVVRGIHERLKAASSVVYFTSPSSDLVLGAARGLPDGAEARLRQVPLSRSVPLTRAIRTGEALWCETRAALFEGFAEVGLRFPPEQLQAACALPFCLDGDVLGGMAFSFASERRFENWSASSC